jgi:hypothetical protein
MKVLKLKVDELFDKREYLFTRRWNSRPVWTLIERVKDDVNGLGMGKRKHILKTPYHFSIAGLLCAIVVSRI